MSAKKIIRAQAREKLRVGGWTKALIGLAIIAMMYLIIESIAALESVIINIFALEDTALFITEVACGSVVTLLSFLLSPVILGYIRMLCTDSDDYDISDVFYYFTSFAKYSKAIAFIFSFAFRMIIPTILCFTLVIAWLLIKHFWFSEFTNDTIMLVLFIITAIAFALRYATRYFLSFYLMCKDEEKPISYYFSASKEVMCEHESDIVKLSNTFIGWFLLCITVLPLLYVLPYFVQALCISAKWLSQLSRNG